MNESTRACAPTRRGTAGQSLPEFLIAVPIFLFLLLMTFQLALIYRAKTILDYAALEAARAGAVTGANMNAMNRALLRGLLPLYATAPGPAGVTEAYLRVLPEMALHAHIHIISPTAQMAFEHRERQYDGRWALPNDNLSYRRTDVKASGVNVQDANILKIRVDYNYRLIVPFVDRVLRGQSWFVRNGANVRLVDETGFWTPWTEGNRIVLSSYAIVRMQSPIYEENSPLAAVP